MNPHSFVSIKHNENEYAYLDTYLNINKYKERARYAMFFFTVHIDGSSTLTMIRYSSDIEDLQSIANRYDKWFNYPLNLQKYLGGGISYINPLE